MPNAAFLGRGSVAALFDSWAREGRADTMAEGHLATAGRVLDSIHPPVGTRFLDVGCGNGYAARRVAARRPDVDLVGLDVAPQMVHRACGLTPALSGIVADASAMPFGDDSFGAAFSMEVLYYLDDPERALRELVRVLSPGGTLDVLVDFYEENPYSASWPTSMGLRMVRWSAMRWRKAFQRAGFGGVTSRQILPEDTTAHRRQAASDSQYASWARDVGSLHIHGTAP